MFRYCEKGWKWLFLTMIALSVVACGDDTDDFSGSAVWRTSSTVGAAEGSAAIQIAGPVGAGWRAEIKDGGAWCSFKLNDPTVLVKEGTVQSSNISNILDVYYTANTGSGERSATIEFEFLGGEPQVLVLTQFSASSTNDPYDEGHATAWAELPEKRLMRILFTSATSLHSITVPCATIRSATTKRSMWRIGWLIRCIRYIGGR